MFKLLTYCLPPLPVFRSPMNLCLASTWWSPSAWSSWCSASWAAAEPSKRTAACCCWWEPSHYYFSVVWLDIFGFQPFLFHQKKEKTYLVFCWKKGKGTVIRRERNSGKQLILLAPITSTLSFFWSSIKLKTSCRCFTFNYQKQYRLHEVFNLIDSILTVLKKDKKDFLLKDNRRLYCISRKKIKTGAGQKTRWNFSKI